MATIEKLIPHVLRWENGIVLRTGETPRQAYGRARAKGVTVTKGDSGGPTMCGVTLSTFIGWRRQQGKAVPTVADLRQLDYDEWLAILKHLFWDPCKADCITNQSVADMLVDWRWLNGPVAVRQAQAALGVTVDGIVGPKTLAALNSTATRPCLSPGEVFARLQAARLRSYDKIVAAKPGQMKFYNGWVNRTNSIKFE